jgi:predicted secreted Zn-dependent protease
MLSARLPFLALTGGASAPALRWAAGLAVALLLAACGETDRSPHRAASGGSASGQAAGAPSATTADDTSSPTGSEAGAPSSKVHVNRTETFYDVTGRSEQALLRDLTRHGPRVGAERRFGRTAWTARWEIAYRTPPPGSNAPCRMRRADVHLDVEVTLPRWNAPDDAPAALRRDWASFTDALAFHEREHRESIVNAGRRLVRALEGLEAPTCTALEEKAGAEARTIIKEARAYNRRYDERTDHGRTQGARWPPE